MADRCASSFEANLQLFKEAALKNQLVLIKAFAALRQSVGLLIRFVTVWKHTKTEHTHTHPTTVTLDACTEG